MSLAVEIDNERLQREMYVVHPDDPGLRYEMILAQTGDQRLAEKEVLEMQRQAAVAGRQMVLPKELLRRMSRRR